MSDPPFVSYEGPILYIVEHSDFDRATVQTVLDIELEYMVAVGILGPPVDEHGNPIPGFAYPFRWYRPGELDGAPRSVDCWRIAEDAERLAGIDALAANEILNCEAEFLAMRGLC